MLLFVFMTVFLSGLMVGRTPEYFGKKIETHDIKWVTLAILVPSCVGLIGGGIACILPEGLATAHDDGPHGLTRILYAFASAAGNNGSAFAGLHTNTLFYNITLGLVMIVCRLAILIPSLAIAGNLAEKKVNPPSSGTFSTNTMLFVSLLLAVILIVGALTFFPTLCLGPIVEHLLMLQARSF